MVCTVCFLSSKCSLFHNSNVFGSCFIRILYTDVLKFKKNNSGTKRLNIDILQYSVHIRILLRNLQKPYNFFESMSKINDIRTKELVHV